jgi:predicted O-linked N-acetylglucosamine transferase (SPINDLY family)
VATSDAALAEWQRGDRRRPAHRPEHRLHALNNSARLLEVMKRLPEAEALMRRSLELQPAQPDVIQHYVHLRQKQCAWPWYQPVGESRPTSCCMGTSAAGDDERQRRPGAAAAGGAALCRRAVPKAPPVALHTTMPPRSGRIRIGYLSGDLHMHAVGLLIARAARTARPQRFEVWAFDWTPESTTPQRQRMLKAIDHHVRLAGVDDATAAR